MLPALATAQGNKGKVSECAPMKNGRVYYRDTVHVKEMNRNQIFNVIEQWAKKNYAKDIFLSNINSDKAEGTIDVSSKVEMLLNDTDKTVIKYKMKIRCHDNSYSAVVSHIVYQYDPLDDKKYKTYPAENVIANNGKSNTVALIKDPQLFCNATYFFVEGLFADIMDAVNKAEL